MQIRLSWWGSKVKTRGSLLLGAPKDGWDGGVQNQRLGEVRHGRARDRASGAPGAAIDQIGGNLNGVGRIPPSVDGDFALHGGPIPGFHQGLGAYDDGSPVADQQRRLDACCGRDLSAHRVKAQRRESGILSGNSGEMQPRQMLRALQSLAGHDGEGEGNGVCARGLHRGGGDFREQATPATISLRRSGGNCRSSSSALEKTVRGHTIGFTGQHDRRPGADFNVIVHIGRKGHRTVNQRALCIHKAHFDGVGAGGLRADGSPAEHAVGRINNGRVGGRSRRRR